MVLIQSAVEDDGRELIVYCLSNKSNRGRWQELGVKQRVLPTGCS